MASPFSGAADPRQRAPNRYGNRTEGHLQNFRDLAITKSFRPQNKTAPILLRQRLHHGHYPRMQLARRELIFRIQARVRKKTFIGKRAAEVLIIPAIAAALPESKIVRHPEQPGFQIVSGAPALQVLEEREEGLLENLLRIRNRQREA